MAVIDKQIIKLRP